MSAPKGMSFGWIVAAVLVLAAASAWWLLIKPLASPAPQPIAPPTTLQRSPAITPPPVAPPTTQATRGPLAPAKAAIIARQFRRAVALLTQITADDPGDWRAWYMLGQAYWNEHRTYSISVQKAIDAWTTALKHIDERDVASRIKVLKDLALIYVRNERLEEARQTYQQLAELDLSAEGQRNYLTQIDEIALDIGTYKPPPNAFYNDAGEVLGPIGPKTMRTNQNFERGRHTQDVANQAKWYRLAVKTDPQMPQAWSNLGVALVLMRKFDEAMEPLKQADVVYRGLKDRNPAGEPYAKSLGWLALCHIEAGNLDEARKLLQIAPMQEALLRLAIAEGQAQGALQRIEQALEQHPEDVPLLYTKALALRSMKRHKQADAVLEQLLEQIPPDHLVYRFQRDHWRQLMSDQNE